LTVAMVGLHNHHATAAASTETHGYCDAAAVIHYVTSWGHSEYEVLGSQANYTVLLDLPVLKTPFSCTCPAFISSVLIAETHVMVRTIQHIVGGAHDNDRKTV
jgi:hypothetical protein